jgi:hypothetical protein
VVVGLPGVAAGVWVKLTLVASTPVRFLAELGVVVLGFAVVGSVLGVIRGADWRYLGNWVRLRTIER